MSDESKNQFPALPARPAGPFPAAPVPTGLAGAFADVLAFHLATGSHVEPMPNKPPVAALRFDLICEEFDELEFAWDRNDLPALADAIADLIYVLIGMATAYGIDLPAVWAAVHRANMTKVGGSRRADGKIQKPEGFVPPDVAAILTSQKPIV